MKILNVRNLAFVVGLFIVCFSLADFFFSNTEVATVEFFIGAVLVLSASLWPTRKPKRMEK